MGDNSTQGDQDTEHTSYVDLNNAPALLTIKQVGDTLGISRGMVYKLVDAGKLERVKFGRAARIRTNSVKRLIA